MAYKLADTRNVAQDLRRCAREEIDHAIEQLNGHGDADRVRAVHETRKSLKKARAVIRLLGEALPPQTRRRDNRALRDVARRLSGTRDFDVMLRTIDTVAERYAGQLPRTVFAQVRSRLEQERASPTEGRLDDDFYSLAEELRAIGERVHGWSLAKSKPTLLEDGLERSYRRARTTYRRAVQDPTEETLHDWRMRTKDLWYHLRLITPLAPGVLGGQADDARALSELLGDDHDVLVLSSRLRQSPHDEAEAAADVDALLGLLGHLHDELREHAFVLGRRVLAERPRAFARRMSAYAAADRAQVALEEARRPQEVAAAASA